MSHRGWAFFALVVGSAGCSAEPVSWPPIAVPGRSDWVDPVPDLNRRLLALTGDEATNCGDLRLRAFIGPPIEDDALETALACGLAANRAGKAFRIVVQHTSIDSWMAFGLTGNVVGAIRQFSYDSAPCGGPGCAPRFEVAPCPSPVVRRSSIRARGTFACAPSTRPAPPTPPVQACVHRMVSNPT
jgi:hypothetical protein